MGWCVGGWVVDWLVEHGRRRKVKRTFLLRSRPVGSRAIAIDQVLIRILLIRIRIQVLLPPAVLLFSLALPLAFVAVAVASPVAVAFEFFASVSSAMLLFHLLAKNSTKPAEETQSSSSRFFFFGPVRPCYTTLTARRARGDFGSIFSVFLVDCERDCCLVNDLVRIYDKWVFASSVLFSTLLIEDINRPIR